MLELDTSVFCCYVEKSQTHKSYRGRYGQWSDETEKKTNNSSEANQHLK